jgi:hypothetical protein
MEQAIINFFTPYIPGYLIIAIIVFIAALILSKGEDEFSWLIALTWPVSLPLMLIGLML